MFKNLLINSGFYLNEKEHNIIKSETLELINELKPLEEFKKNSEYKDNYIKLSELRNDEIKPSVEKSQILKNSESKNDDGFIVSKII